MLILSSYVSLSIQSCLFPSDLQLKSCMHATFPAHPILLDLITLIFERRVQIRKPIFSFLHSPIISTLKGLNIILNVPFSSTINLQGLCRTTKAWLQCSYDRNVFNICREIAASRFGYFKAYYKHVCASPGRRWGRLGRLSGRQKSQAIIPQRLPFV